MTLAKQAIQCIDFTAFAERQMAREH